MVRALVSAGVGVLALLVAGELVFRVLPVSTATQTDYHLDPDLLTYPPHHRWQVSSGWALRHAQSLQANNWGFLADHDFAPDADAVALIGDSYVESSMLDAKDRPAAQLERLLGGRKVYAMGTPGTALLDYAQRIRVAHERFQVRDVVIFMQPLDAGQSLCGSGHVVSRCLDPGSFEPRIERQAPSGFLKNVLRHSALLQYVMSQIRFKPSALVRSMFTRSTPEMQDAPAPAHEGRSLPVDPNAAARSRQMVDAVLEHFFATVAPLGLRKLVVAMDGDRSGLAPETPLMKLERDHLMRRLRERGALVLDMQPVYAANAALTRRAINVAPQDAHLNRIGVRLVMEPVSNAL
ncbi:hypothetical protein [Hydrogenophaga sp. BPS33]|uniref:hypothetical protein n=1 Tax=Hydrogenophaga sp. BPS33 TaxID=2651974 RepID=UPI0013202652|nr:hypothetical protein [Hydrogenophaga sp. BPS33]QHE85928.1 hypothetical protein F9K07_13935 [Hydrogenophaga sp. BPS33]